MIPGKARRQGRATSKRFLPVFVVLLAQAIPGPLFGQGDGPRTFIPRPVGTQSFIPFYVHLDTNLNLEQSILLEGANLRINVGGAAYRNFFALFDRPAQVSANAAWGEITGTVEPGGPFAGLPDQRIPRSSGLIDPTIAFAISLFGAPALRMPDFARTPPKFQGSAVLAVSFPFGEYDEDRPFNIGNNRWLIRFGLPLVVPLGDPRTRTFLEITPGVLKFTDNNDAPGPAERLEQEAMYVLESHLSRNFTPLLWSSIDVRMQRGGATESDGVENDDRIGQIGAGVTLGYVFAGFVGLDATFASIVFRNDGSRGWMFRTRLAAVW